MTEYFAELTRRFPDGFDPVNAVEEAGEMFNPPRGVFMIALLGGAAIGCGAIRHLDEHTAEIKRMWVSPRSRGCGVGRRLLENLEHEAGRAGRSRIVLDTNDSLTEAISMYRAHGYVAIDKYNDNPYAERWFAKHLHGRDDARSTAARSATR